MAVRHIISPFDENTARSLRAGEKVLIDGTVITARDAAHKHLVSAGVTPVDLKGIVIYHCGPVTIRTQNQWKVIAAGPTTSIREEPYEADIIERFGPSAIMGKGGMGERTLDAMKKCGCVYLHATGGAAAYLAECINIVKDVHFLNEFGQPEAMWVFDVTGIPAVVTMDTFGTSLHDEMEKVTRMNLERLIGT